MSLARFPVVAVLVVWMAWRAFAIDMYFLPKWRAGWRPWQPALLFKLPLQVIGSSALAIAPRSWSTEIRVWYRRRRQQRSLST